MLTNILEQGNTYTNSGISNSVTNENIVQLAIHINTLNSESVPNPVTLIDTNYLPRS